MTPRRQSPATPRRGRYLPLVVGVVLIIGLFGAMAIEPTRRLLDQRERVAEARSDLRRTERLNAKLAARIERLNDPDFLEQRAREQMGLVYPGEQSYVVMPSKKASRPHRAKKIAPAPTVADPGFVHGLLEFVGLGWAL